jgi:cytochrome c-type biogenesis protein CcmH/NrfG
MVRTFFIAATLLLSVPAAFSQVPNRPPAAPPPTPNTPQQYEIRGKLIFSVARPPEERIEVVLERNMQRVQTAFTDSIGNFEFRNLSAGEYFVVVRYEGFEDVNQQVSVFSMSHTNLVSVQMNPLVTLVRKPARGFEGDDPDVIDIKQMLKTYPKKAVQEYEKALDENKKGATERAIGHFEQAIKIAPEFYHAFNNLGVAYVRLQRFREGETAYRRAKEINPKAEQPLLNLAILYINESDMHRAEGRSVYGKYLDDAMDCLDEAIKLRPRSAMAHFFLGTAYYKSDFLDEAEKTLKLSQEFDPEFGKTRIMLVNVYTKQRRLKDALDQVDAFLRENPRAEEREAIQELRQKILKGMETTP